MATPIRPTGRRWAACISAVLRMRVALALSPAIALLGLAVGPALPAQAAVGCSIVFNQNASALVNYSGGAITLTGFEFAGHYNGNTVVPSSTVVTSAGEEAQCLLERAAIVLGRPDFNPGTIDGVFGPNSHAAATNFQFFVNSTFSGALTVDGSVGPHTWPWLRWYS
jgi:peptidoglycan hydrolase-like protein with peptidoglycan-binding domain